MLEDIAVILESSGTSGEPRFYEISRAQLVRTLERDALAMGITQNDRLLTFCPLNHTFGLYAVLQQLGAGGCVILPHEFSRAELVAGLTKRPTWMAAVPPVVQAIYEARKDDRLKPLFSGLRLIRTSGSPLDPALEVSFEQEYGVPVLNGYGSTEIPCVSRNTLSERRTGSVGKPVSGVTVRIANDGQIIASDADRCVETGDFGHFEDGFLFVDQPHKGTARKKTWKERPVTC